MQEHNHAIPLGHAFYIPLAISAVGFIEEWRGLKAGGKFPLDLNCCVRLAFLLLELSCNVMIAFVCTDNGNFASWHLLLYHIYYSHGARAFYTMQGTSLSVVIKCLFILLRYFKEVRAPDVFMK